jgi:hypothetical protein
MERKYTLKEKIIMYFAMWVYLIVFALKDFLWCLHDLILSFLPFMWKVEDLQPKRLPILRSVIYILDYFLWKLRDKVGKIKRNKMKSGKD